MAPTGPSGGPKIIDGMFTFEVDLYKPLGARLGIDVMLFRSQSGSSLIVESVNEGGIVEAWNQQSQEPIRIRTGDFIVKVNGVEGNMTALSGALRTGQEFRITVQRVAHTGFGQGAFGGGGAAFGSPLAITAQPQQSMAIMPRTPLAANHAPSPAVGAALARGSPPVMEHLPSEAGPDITTSPAASDPMNQFVCEVVLLRREGAKLGIDVLPVTMGETGGLSVKSILKGGVVDEWNQTSHKNFNIRPGDCIICVNNVMADLAQMMEELRTQHELRLTVLRRRGTANSAGAPPGPVGPGNLAGLPGGPVGNGPNVPGGSNQYWGTTPGLSEHGIDNWGFGIRESGVGGSSGPLDDTAIPAHGPGTPYIANGERVIRFDVELEKKPCMRLGLDVMLVKGNGLCDLVVERVASGGCVDQWNHRSRPPHLVQPGDYIVQVNGVGAWQNLSRIADAFSRDAQQVRFTVRRGHDPIIPPQMPGPVPPSWHRSAFTGVAPVAAAVPPPPPALLPPRMCGNSASPRDWNDIPVPCVPPIPPRIAMPTPGLGGAPAFPKEPHIASAKAVSMPCPVFESPEPPPPTSLGMPPVPHPSFASSIARDGLGSTRSAINSAGVDAEDFSMPPRTRRPPPGLEKASAAFLEPDVDVHARSKKGPPLHMLIANAPLGPEIEEIPDASELGCNESR